METENKEAVFSESVSENKRRCGRPTVFQRDHMEGMERLCVANKYRTRRNHVAEYYRSSVFGILEDHNDIPYLEEIFRIDGDACIQKDEIIEQLGRMYAQDGYGEDTIVDAATLAAKFNHNGNISKQKNKSERFTYGEKVRIFRVWCG